MRIVRLILSQNKNNSRIMLRFKTVNLRERKDSNFNFFHFSVIAELLKTVQLLREKRLNFPCSTGSHFFDFSK